MTKLPVAFSGGSRLKREPVAAAMLAMAMSLYQSVRGSEQVYFDAAVTLLFFLLIGRYLDHRLRQQARTAAGDLLALQAVTGSRLGADGRLTGYSGGIERKAALLALERASTPLGQRTLPLDIAQGAVWRKR